MTFEEFAKANHERCCSPEGFRQMSLQEWSMDAWMVATLGELGEAANVLKKLNRERDGYAGNKVDGKTLRQNFKRELGDVFVYLDLMAQAAGFTIEEAAREVWNAKSAEIGYPIMLGDERDSPSE